MPSISPCINFCRFPGCKELIHEDKSKFTDCPIHKESYVTAEEKREIEKNRIIDEMKKETEKINPYKWYCNECGHVSNTEEKCLAHGPMLDHDEAIEQCNSQMEEAISKLITEFPDAFNVYIPKTEKSNEKGKKWVSEYYTYSHKGIYLESVYSHVDKKDKLHTTITKKPILIGNLQFISCVKFEDYDNNSQKWQILFNNNKYIGGFEEICTYLFAFGSTTAKKDDLKIALAMVIVKVAPDAKLVHPSVGLYLNKETGKPFLAENSSHVHPITDTQRTFLAKFEHQMQTAKEDKYKEVLQASVDFINAMPLKNKKNALFTRGYSCIAPLSYILKESFIGVFPYIYLYGSTGSSKTHIADTSATYVFGEHEHLTSEAVESSFRLGMEFTAGIVPRVIDEAHDVFVKNLSIFKSGATSNSATKRGNKDKTIDKYPALATFIFTSNTIPINPEEDSHGGIMDRVFILHCVRDDDFKKELYQGAHPILINHSAILGKKIFERLYNILDQQGLDYVVKEIVTLSNIFQKLDKATELRRSYCLAELALGVKLYYEMLKAEGIELPVNLKDDAELCDYISKTLQENAKIESRQNLINFMDFVANTTKLDLDMMCERGIYPAYGNIPRYDEIRRRHFCNGDEFLITNAAFNKFKQANSLKSKPYNHLNEFMNDLSLMSWKEKPTNNKDHANTSKWSLRISLQWYYQALDDIINDAQVDFVETKPFSKPIEPSNQA